MNKKRRATSGGVELTDELVEDLASEAERGYSAKTLARGRRRGRPPIGSSAATIFQVRLEPELRAALEAQSDAEETTPSEIARRALREYVTNTSRGKRKV